LRVLMEWLEWMWRVTLSLANTEARPSGTPQTEMAMRWSNVTGAGRKCGCMQGCCVGSRLGARNY